MVKMLMQRCSRIARNAGFWGVLLLGSSVWAWASVAPHDTPSPDVLETPESSPFPLPAGLEAQVALWRNVYGVWGLGQVALHDAVYPGLVYEVVDLPGAVREGLTQTQQDYLQGRRRELEESLQRIALLADDPAFLSDDDNALRRRIVDAAGSQAVAEAYLRVRGQRGLRERFQRGLEISGRYDRAFRAIFREAGVPEDLAYLPHVESSFQNHARSAVGAAGMWQFTRATGQAYLKMNAVIDERLDPILAAQATARYLRHAHDVLGDWALAITSYNHGVQGMVRARAQFGADFARIVREYKAPSFGFASRNFYPEFLAAREVASHPERYFPEGLSVAAPLARDHVLITKPLLPRRVASTYGVSMETLADMNPAWSAAATRGKAKLPAGTTVWLPKTGARGEGREKLDIAEAKAPHVSNSKARSSAAAFHVVKPKDTLYAIAKHYGLSVAQLREINDMAPREEHVRSGQKLHVRDVQEQGGDSVVHVVRPGDSPALIAANYGVTVAQLLTTNQLNRRSVIQPGQRLDIPATR